MGITVRSEPNRRGQEDVARILEFVGADLAVFEEPRGNDFILVEQVVHVQLQANVVAAAEESRVETVTDVEVDEERVDALQRLAQGGIGRGVAHDGGGAPAEATTDAEPAEFLVRERIVRACVGRVTRVAGADRALGPDEAVDDAGS